MGVLTRFKDIMASNFNALLDKAEDPEKMVDQYLRNLESDLAKVKAEAASVMAEEKSCKRKLDECNSEIERMTEYAKKATADLGQIPKMCSGFFPMASFSSVLPAS